MRIDKPITVEEAKQMLREHPALFDSAPVFPPPRRKGILECPVCGWPRGEKGFLQAPVPLGHPLWGRLVQCPACWEGYLPEYLRRLSGLSERMLHWDLESMVADEGRRPARDAARRFVRDPCGWLTFWGEYGVGKTYTLAAIVNALLGESVAAMYVVLPDLLDAWRRAYDPSAPVAFDCLFAEVRDVPVLALDEMGQVKMTSWGLEKLFQLLDHRYRNAVILGTVMALNFEPVPGAVPEEWPPRAGAILSRMQEYRVVEISGGDLRGV